MTTEIFAKETLYKGEFFRSMLEARWAIFFDRLGIKWEYEKELFVSRGLKYLPDFWLPAYESFVEIKPVARFEGFEKCAALAREKKIVVLCGQPFPRGVSAWASISSQLRQVPTCEFGICPRCKVPILGAAFSSDHGDTQWAPLLAPSRSRSPSRLCVHRFVHSPLEITASDNEREAMAKLLLKTAYNNARDAQQICGVQPLRAALRSWWRRTFNVSAAHDMN